MLNLIIHNKFKLEVKKGKFRFIFLKNLNNNAIIHKLIVGEI